MTAGLGGYPTRAAAAAVVARSAVLALALWTGAAAAHDTWFALRGSPRAGDRFLALGTGNVYPVFDSSLGAEHLHHTGCRSAGQNAALVPVAKVATSLILRARLAVTSTASCWAQLLPSEIELSDDLVAVYMDEARPSAAVRIAWAALQARGLPWRELYTKHSRIVLRGEAAGRTAAVTTASPLDMGLIMGLDMLLLGNDGPLRAGDTASVQLLRDGQPLPGLAVELRTHAGAAETSSGVWLQTDAEGQVRLALPTAGRWLLRGIDIRPSATVTDTWESRFVTLAFEVAPPTAR